MRAATPSTHAERGSALVLAIFVLVLLAAMGVGLLTLIHHETQATQASTRTKRAFYLAEAGLEDARRTLYDLNGSGSFNNDLTTVAGADGVMTFDPSLLTVNYHSDGRVAGLSGYADDLPLRPLTALSDSGGNGGWYAAFLTNDPADGGGRHSQVDTNSRVMLTAVGLTTRRGMEIVEGIIEPISSLPQPPGAGITLIGPQPSFNNGSSNAQSHSGNDCAATGDGEPGLYVPIVGTTSGSAADDVRDGMQRPGSFTAGSGNPPAYTGEDTVGDLTDPTDPIVAASGMGPLDPVWTDCQALKALLTELAATANYYCNSGSSTCVTPATAPGMMMFIDGDMTIGDNDTSYPGAGPYYGSLVVTGTVTFSGGTTWEGIVMAIGEGRVIRSGGGSGHISGSIIVANIAGPNGVYGDSDDCTTDPDGFGSASYTVGGGGNSEVSYCSNQISLNNPVRTYKIVQFLQR